MKIVHIANHVQEAGNGIVNVMVDLACEQSKMGHEVVVVSGGGSYINLLMKHGVEHCHLDQTRKPVSMLQAFFQFRLIMNKIKPDIIHAHMMTGALLSRCLKGLGSYKIVTHVHNEFQKHANLMKVGDSVIAVSDAVSKSMVTRGIQEQKLRVVLNGTIGSPRKHESDGIVLQGRSIVTVAGMYHRKGIEDLLAAFSIAAANIEDAHLYLVGEGPERQLFEAQASQSPFHERIHFEGFQKDSYKYMVSADLFVLASHKDPFPLVLIEAREAGCAIIATSVDGIPEALDYGESGKLVPPKQPELLANAMVQLLESKELLAHYRNRAQIGLHFYRVQRVAEQTLQIYTEVLGK